VALRLMFPTLPLAGCVMRCRFNEDDAAVQGQALEVLAQLAKVERTQPRLRAVATTLPRILKTLRKHMKHSDIVLFATLTLTALAKHKGMAREIGREGGVEALLEVLKPKWSQVVEVDALQQTLWALDQLVASYGSSRVAASPFLFCFCVVMAHGARSYHTTDFISQDAMSVALGGVGWSDGQNRMRGEFKSVAANLF